MSGRPWQPLPELCEAVAAVHGMRRARPATLAGLAVLLARGTAECRVLPPGRHGAGGRPARSEFRLAVGRGQEAPDAGRVTYAGEGRWRADARGRAVSGIAGLEDATFAAADLLLAA